MKPTTIIIGILILIITTQTALATTTTTSTNYKNTILDLSQGTNTTTSTNYKHTITIQTYDKLQGEDYNLEIQPYPQLTTTTPQDEDKVNTTPTGGGGGGAGAIPNIIEEFGNIPLSIIGDNQTLNLTIPNPENIYQQIKEYSQKPLITKAPMITPLIILLIYILISNAVYFLKIKREDDEITKKILYIIIIPIIATIITSTIMISLLL